MSDLSLEERVAKLEKSELRTQVLLERIDSHYQTIKEGLDVLLKMPLMIEVIQQDVEKLKVDVAFLKSVAHSH